MDPNLPSSFDDDRPRPQITVDMVIFSVFEGTLKVVLVRRNHEPFKDSWALPGGFVSPNESLDDAARRVLMERVGVRDLFLDQLYTFGSPHRDPRGRVVTVAYYALVAGSALTLEARVGVAEVKWWNMYDLPPLAFDHKQILEYALRRLRIKCESTNLGFEFLPEKFTLTELQDLHETILARKLDKRNFRRKMHVLGVLEELDERKMDGVHRPARLYRFKPEKYEALKQRGLVVPGAS